MAGERWPSFKPDSGSFSHAAMARTAGAAGFGTGFAATGLGAGFFAAGTGAGTAFDFTKAGFFATGAAFFAGDFLAGGRWRFFMT